MSEPLSPAAFIAQARTRIPNTFIHLLGFHLCEVSAKHAVAEMSFRESLQQLTGVFHAGALVSLADTTATFACIYWRGDALDASQSSFPLTIQLSSNFIRNTNSGNVTACAVPVHQGRTTIVVETRVTDADDRLLSVVTTTHLVVGKASKLS
jgi:1,4-dihydroxy-2-naphthoyl-CoA hydrolase